LSARSLWQVAIEFTTRADDSHAAPVEVSGLDTGDPTFPPGYFSHVKPRIRFFA